MCRCACVRAPPARTFSMASMFSSPIAGRVSCAPLVPMESETALSPATCRLGQRRLGLHGLRGAERPYSDSSCAPQTHRPLGGDDPSRHLLGSAQCCQRGAGTDGRCCGSCLTRCYRAASSPGSGPCKQAGGRVERMSSWRQQTAAQCVHYGLTPACFLKAQRYVCFLVLVSPGDDGPICRQSQVGKHTPQHLISHEYTPPWIL